MVSLDGGRTAATHDGFDTRGGLGFGRGYVPRNQRLVRHRTDSTTSGTVREDYYPLAGPSAAGRETQP